MGGGSNLVILIPRARGEVGRKLGLGWGRIEFSGGVEEGGCDVSAQKEQRLWAETERMLAAENSSEEKGSTVWRR